MKAVLKAFVLLVALAIVVVGIGVWYITRRGVSAQEQPTAAEQYLARRVRDIAIAGHAKTLTNPVQSSPEVIAEGREHFADHCAICHGNDGSGSTEVGRGLWPKPPDMRLAQTQNLTDGELFWIIENGVRFTGMPAWKHAMNEGENDSWNLVHFIRHLPKQTPEEIKAMEALNPKAPGEGESEHTHKEGEHEHTHQHDHK